MDWVVLTVSPNPRSATQYNRLIYRHQWNQPSIDFYEKRLGAKRMSDWVGMRLEEAGIADLRNLV
jgi:hypothetical protein